MGIEPTSVAWEATALPLSYARIAGESLCGGAGVAQWQRAAMGSEPFPGGNGSDPRRNRSEPFPCGKGPDPSGCCLERAAEVGEQGSVLRALLAGRSAQAEVALQAKQLGAGAQHDGGVVLVELQARHAVAAQFR